MKPDFDRWQRTGDQEAKIDVLEKYFEKYEKYPRIEELEELINQYWEDKRYGEELRREEGI
jgi:DNA-binding SARP family transcriptional activator